MCEHTCMEGGQIGTLSISLWCSLSVCFETGSLTEPEPKGSDPVARKLSGSPCSLSTVVVGSHFYEDALNLNLGLLAFTAGFLTH